MQIRVCKIEHGFMFGIDAETGRKENFHYAKKTGAGFEVREKSLVNVEISKAPHQPARITKVLSCEN